MVEIDVLIIGAGPAGVSTAMHLHALDPTWAKRIIVLEKAVHPRPKLCGGGVTRLGVDALQHLGLAFELAHVPVREMRIHYRHRRFVLRDDPVFRVVHRPEFDHWLVKEARARGADIREGEPALSIQEHPHAIAVRTSKRQYLAQTVVVADGARSWVRQKLRWGKRGRSARLLEILTPIGTQPQPLFQRDAAIFDFSFLRQGLQGYIWTFPSQMQGQAWLNRGVYDSRIHAQERRAPLRRLLEEDLARTQQSLDAATLQGHPIFWFRPEASISRPRILLVGDAAGVDPLLGEGISFALWYGDAAAQTLAAAFARNDFSFRDFKTRVLEHPVLHQLRGRYLAARFSYWLTRHPHLADILWALAPVIFSLLVHFRPTYVPLHNPRLIRVE